MSNSVIATGQIYHTYNRSIAGYKIFNSDSEYKRIEELIQYYQVEQPVGFSKFKERNKGDLIKKTPNKRQLVEVVCYSPMPTHIHLTLKQLIDKGISKFMNNILSSYSHYFNIKHNRKGPLWEGRFKKVLVETDEQLLHLTRYIHLNPVTDYLINKPEKWKYSSYKEYIAGKESICSYKDVLDVTPETYKKFTEDQISYQRELKKVKHLMFD
ncbi:MAG: transposase [Candidatus Gorgyraea atricola]|nr:transposase [Candidatus Gorgyraea atricola]